MNLNNNLNRLSNFELNIARDVYINNKLLLKRNGVDEEAIKIFSQAIQKGSVIYSLPKGIINNNFAERCFKAAVKPFVEGNKQLPNMMVFLFAKQSENSIFKDLPKELFDLIKVNLFQAQTSELEKLSFGDFCSNQLSYAAQLKLVTVNANDNAKQFFNPTVYKAHNLNISIDEHKSIVSQL
jgi:hypothetical protein